MEEEKIPPAGYRSRSKDFHGLTEITDPRKEKRKAFMEISLQNLIEKLIEQKLNKDREKVKEVQRKPGKTIGNKQHRNNIG